MNFIRFMCIMLRQNIAGAHNESGYRNNRKKLQDFFETNKTKSYEFRISQLLKLQEVLNQNKKELLNALYSDLHKTEMEGFFSEFAIVRGELKFAIKHLKNGLNLKGFRPRLLILKAQAK